MWASSTTSRRQTEGLRPDSTNRWVIVQCIMTTTSMNAAGGDNAYRAIRIRARWIIHLEQELSIIIVAKEEKKQRPKARGHRLCNQIFPYRPVKAVAEKIALHNVGSQKTGCCLVCSRCSVGRSRGRERGLIFMPTTMIT